MKLYLVQELTNSGDIHLSLLPATRVIEMQGLSDCSNSEYEVFLADEFGKVIRLEYVPDMKMPNHHTWISTETGEVIIEGMSSPH